MSARSQISRTKPGMASCLTAEGRHHPGVDHVVGGGDDAHLLVDRQHQRVVDLQQVVVALRMARVGHLALGDVERGQEADALALALDVVVAPLPLVAGGLDRQVGIGRCPSAPPPSWWPPRHADDDQERHHGPGDLHRHASWKLAAGWPFGFAMLEDRIEHHAEHGEEDHQAHDQHAVVQHDDVGRHLAGRRMQVELVDRGTAGQVVDRQRRQRPTRCGQSRQGLRPTLPRVMRMFMLRRLLECLQVKPCQSRRRSARRSSCASWVRHSGRR